MKSISFFFGLCLILLLASCKSATAPAQKSSCVIGGKYLNYTVLEHCPDILPGEVPSYALEINFKSKDTVDLFNGFERFRMPYTGPTDSCTYTIKGATQFGDMKFRVQGDTMVQLYDSAWTQLNRTSVFRRIDDSKLWGFSNYLNECVIVGTWNLIKEGVGKDHKVIFLRNGQVDGMSPYLSYDICYAGDCLEETEPFSNTIDFLDDHNKHTAFAITIVPGRRTIKFYSIGDPVPDQKGGRKIGPLAFELKQ
ncbi:MAG TPA: hypothetical protein VFG10_00955 [Saprospiraceae bacterium]|nr:hypothetical protein [Saprospiraceae bacterium]